MASASPSNQNLFRWLIYASKNNSHAQWVWNTELLPELRVRKSGEISFQLILNQRWVGNDPSKCELETINKSTPPSRRLPVRSTESRF